MLLTEEQTINLIEHPKRWDGRVVTVKIYPYDFGNSVSYVACFETCDEARAMKSPVSIETRTARFKGLKGDVPVVVTVRYSSRCAFEKSRICGEQFFGNFVEIEGPISD